MEGKFMNKKVISILAIGVVAGSFAISAPSPVSAANNSVSYHALKSAKKKLVTVTKRVAYYQYSKKGKYLGKKYLTAGTQIRIKKGNKNSWIIYLTPASKKLLVVKKHNGWFETPNISTNTSTNTSSTYNSQTPVENNATSTTSNGQSNVTTTTESAFTGFPAGASYLEKWDIVKSLTGAAREQAENALMSELGLTTSTGTPLVSSQAFEDQFNKISGVASDMYNYVMQR